jgi:DNA phosphorothioation-associated putative methyltransferase
VVTGFGSLKRGFALVRRVTGDAEWDAIGQRRTEDLLVYLALARFRKRPPLGRLPRTLQRDMRAFFGTYSKACQRADELLFRVGDAAT